MGYQPLSRKLSRREREIMDIVYRRGRVTVTQVRQDLPQPPSYSAVRATLRVLEEKGFLRHVQEGPRYVFSATVARGKVRRSALDHLLKTFFDGSAEEVVATLLEGSSRKLSHQELERIAALVEKAQGDGDD